MHFPKNVGPTDRTIRLAVAAVLVVAGIWTNTIVLSLIALVVLVTGYTGVCPVYIPLKIDTNKERED